MRDAAILFGPIVEVRDVLESYLNDRVLVEDWRSTLSKASARLVELGISWDDDELSELGMHLQVLARDGLGAKRQPVLDVAQTVDAILEGLRIPGIPTPSDADWAF